MTSVVRTLVLTCVLTLPAMQGCKESVEKNRDPHHSIQGSTMGTYFRVKMGELPAGLSEEKVEARVNQRLETINALMSTYLEDSEVSRFNRSRHTDWFPVSAETATVVAAALKVHAESGGAFDITVGPLVDHWGFGPEERSHDLPSLTEIRLLLDSLGSRHLQVRHDPPALRKDRESIRIDLSGIAKGFAVDAIAGTLDEFGVTSYLIDIGGEMRARGRKPDQSSWTIAIERPSSDQRGIQATLPLDDQALATSGDYRNYFEKDGQRYSHEIDPRTGKPIRHSLVSVSVLDSSCMHADAWATALIVLGPEKGATLAKQAGLPVFMILKDDQGFREISTPGFTAHSP